MSIKKPERTVEVISERGRDGIVEASDGSLRIDFTKTAEKGAAPTAEHLFAAAFAACFHSALRHAAQVAHADITGSTVVARVSIGENERGHGELAVELHAAIPRVSRDQAAKLLHQAHSTCPYSRAVHGNVDVRLSTD